MPKYEVKSIFRYEPTKEVYIPGSTIELTEAQAKKFPDGYIEKVGAKGTPKTDK
ncbi:MULTISPECIES: hypothetical protein [unclassified Aerococcus]|uniref:hypothetical protein n=1 Tax=unclassified Aerococcus TaxID=2618060 RepID=UPI0025BF49AF|nr:MULTISPECIES: hypothetical protein [unclassified Aerococcus]